LRRLVYLALGLALFALWLSALHWLASIVCSLLLLALAALNLVHPGSPLAQGRVRWLRCNSSAWQLELDSGATVEILPQPGSVLLPALVVLRARTVDFRESCTLVLMRDGFPAEIWRQLQLNLRQALSTGSG
jgi:hypothetical protein